MLDVRSLLESLARRRPIFHSEADFQHEFAWEIRLHHPDCAVRLEVPTGVAGTGTTDLTVRLNDRIYGIELKYLTRRLECSHGDETFGLKAQGATDLRRYDVLKDIQRLEKFNDVFGGPSFVIALTNDSAYWNTANAVGTIDAAFRLGDGREVSGELAWASHASSGSIKNREATLVLNGKYELAWDNYSAVPQVGGTFRYLCVEITWPT